MTLSEKYFDKKENLKIRKNIKKYFGLDQTLPTDYLMISGGQIFFCGVKPGKIEYTLQIERELKLNSLLA